MTTDAERLAAVRRRAIRDFYDGTSSKAIHWWKCSLCGWMWRDGATEQHELGCPLEKE